MRIEFDYKDRGDLKQLNELILNTNWVYAKTYKDFAPHEYIQRKGNYELCYCFDILIDKCGVRESFIFPQGEKKYDYFYFGDFKYWYTNRGFILNRCPKQQYKSLNVGEIYG